MKKGTLEKSIKNNASLIRIMLQSSMIENLDNNKIIQIMPDKPLTEKQIASLPSFCIYNGSSILITGLTLDEIYSTINSSRNLLKSIIRDLNREFNHIKTRLEKLPKQFQCEAPHFELTTATYHDARHLQTLINATKRLFKLG